MAASRRRQWPGETSISKDPRGLTCQQFGQQDIWQFRTVSRTTTLEVDRLLPVVRDVAATSGAGVLLAASYLGGPSR
jgi:hypothetical protein